MIHQSPDTCIGICCTPSPACIHRIQVTRQCLTTVMAWRTGTVSICVGLWGMGDEGEFVLRKKNKAVKIFSVLENTRGMLIRYQELLVIWISKVPLKATCYFEKRRSGFDFVISQWRLEWTTEKELIFNTGPYGDFLELKKNKFTDCGWQSSCSEYIFLFSTPSPQHWTSL